MEKLCIGASIGRFVAPSVKVALATSLHHSAGNPAPPEEEMGDAVRGVGHRVLCCNIWMWPTAFSIRMPLVAIVVSLCLLLFSNAFLPSVSCWEPVESLSSVDVWSRVSFDERFALVSTFRSDPEELVEDSSSGEKQFASLQDMIQFVDHCCGADVVHMSKSLFASESSLSCSGGVSQQVQGDVSLP